MRQTLPRAIRLLALALLLVTGAPGPRAEPRAPTPSLTDATPRECGLASRPPGVHLHRLESHLLGRSLPVLVLAPDRAPGERLPLLILLHGLGARPAAWLDAGIHARLAAAAQDGALRRAVVAIPTGEDGYWTDWADGAHPWGRMVVEEVLPAVQAAYDTRPGPASTAIAGVSMGGFGALSLGLRHPERFGAIVALSPTDMVIAVQDEPTRRVYRDVFGTPPDPAAVRAVNPRDLVLAGAGAGQRIILIVGDAEPRKFSEGTRLLAEALAERGAPPDLRVVAGGRHDFSTTWARASQRWWMERLEEAWTQAGAAPSPREPALP